MSACFIQQLNYDHLSDEALITLYARLSLKYNHLPDALRARAISAELNVSFPRLKQIATKLPVFVNDRLSNEELRDAAAAFCSKTGLVEPHKR